MLIEIMLVVLILLNILLLVTVLIKNRDKVFGAYIESIESIRNKNYEKLLETIEGHQFKNERKIMDEFARNREGFNHAFKDLREEVHNSVSIFSNSTVKRITEMSELQNTQFENIRKTIENRLNAIREDNSKKLEEMRIIVDEKLHSTLEKRLGEAFKQVGDRLEKVHLGLGEMQKLAAGVGDLKKVLTNVKARGTLGEVQLESQLEQLLSKQQYEKNVKTKKGGNAYVEFALKLPGKDEANGCVWLPVDSKFPLGQYEALLNAYDAGDKELIARASKKLSAEIKQFAKDIKGKYINPPETTDFALMYLPIEGLYAEVLRFAGLFETLQRECGVVPVGPTTLAAILNSLQMGFRTLAIEKRSSDVWKLLGVVKTHFGKFGELLDKTRKKLDEAGKSIEDASKKTRYIEGRLTRVQELPEETGVPEIEETFKVE